MAAAAHIAARPGWRPGPLPGFRPTLGFTLLYLSLVVLLPLAALILKTAGLSWGAFWATVTSSRALAAYKLSFGGALLAGGINTVAGLLLSWVLVRYRFPGRDVVDAIIDLPLALPTAVAGIALTAIYAPTGAVGGFLERHGVQVAFTWAGVVLAMVFVGLPFAVRSVQPVLMELGPELEEAAAVLGASRLRTFSRVILPVLVPPLLTGFALAFARAVGEYGSIVFISGNMPNHTEIVPLLIVTKLEQFQYQQATALAVVMLAGSLVTLLAVNLLQAWNRRWTGHA
ncbi:MAG: sulfate ABC transporter permease subunit CysT [Polyangia bacterium]